MIQVRREDPLDNIRTVLQEVADDKDLAVFTAANSPDATAAAENSPNAGFNRKILSTRT